MALSHKQSGITMIEVLVSILIFSFGMLGLAGLQTASLRFQQSAWARSAVARLTAEIADSARVNMDGARAGAYQFVSAYPYPAAATPPVAPVNCKLNLCDATQLAQYDLNQWIASAVRDMPAGWANVQTRLGAMGALPIVQDISVSVIWNDKEAPNDVAPSCAADPTNRNCCPIAVPTGVRCITTVFLP